MRCRESLYKDDEILFQNSNIEEIKKDASARAMKGQEGKQKNEKKVSRWKKRKNNNKKKNREMRMLKKKGTNEAMRNELMSLGGVKTVIKN